MTEIRIVRGDITQIPADAIVNAANQKLYGGSGVDGAIHRAGGAIIDTECATIRARQGGCDVGDAVITHAGNLPAQYVIHCVGPVWLGGKHDEARLLAKTYLSALALAESYHLRSISFPNISTGVFHFPLPLARDIVRDKVIPAAKASSLDAVIFVCHDAKNFALYQEIS